MNERPDDKTLRKVFSDIIKGFSTGNQTAKPFAVKHFRQEDQGELEAHYDKIYEKARSNELPTEKESLELLIEEDLWSKEEEGELDETEKYLENLQQTKKHLIRNINKDIKKAENMLGILKIKRQSLLTETCESYAKNKNNDFSLYLCLYKEGDLQAKFFTWDEFCEMPKAALREMFKLYMGAVTHLSMENIKYLAISTIFTSSSTLLVTPLPSLPMTCFFSLTSFVNF